MSSQSTPALHTATKSHHVSYFRKFTGRGRKKEKSNEPAPSSKGPVLSQSTVNIRVPRGQEGSSLDDIQIPARSSPSLPQPFIPPQLSFQDVDSSISSKNKHKVAPLRLEGKLEKQENSVSSSSNGVKSSSSNNNNDKLPTLRTSRGRRPRDGSIGGSPLIKTKSEGDMRELSDVSSFFNATGSTDINAEFKIPAIARTYTRQGVSKRGHFSHAFKVEYVVPTSRDTIDKVSRLELAEGTLSDGVEWCSFYPGSVTVRNFLFGYRIGGRKPAALLDACLALWQSYGQRDAEFLEEARDRLFSFLVQWILYWGCVDFDDHFTLSFLAFAENVLKQHNNRSSVKHIRKLLKNEMVLQSKPGILAETMQAPLCHARRAKSSTQRMHLSHSRAKIVPFISRSRDIAPPKASQVTPSFCDLLFVETQVLADQLTLMEMELLRKVTVSEFVDKRWAQTPRSPHSSSSNLRASHRRASDASPEHVAAPGLVALSNHFNSISLWVASAIIATVSPKKQAALFRHFVRTAQRLFKMRNYSACSQIVNGLQNVSVSRLKALYVNIHQKYLDSLERLYDDLGPNDNYATYRCLNFSPPCLPLLPVLLRDLTFYYDTAQDYMDEKQTVINYQKINDIATAVYNLNIFRKNDVPYVCNVDAEVQRIIHSTLKLAMDEEQLYNMSVILQPVLHISNDSVVSEDAPDS